MTMLLKKTRFGEIMTGLSFGAAYCFDARIVIYGPLYGLGR